jgi:hypothetical protein
MLFDTDDFLEKRNASVVRVEKTDKRFKLVEIYIIVLQTKPHEM